MLGNKKDQKVYTRKSLVMHFICTTVPVLTLQYAKKSYRLHTQMKTAARKNDPVEKLCRVYVMNMSRARPGTKKNLSPRKEFRTQV